MANDNMPQVEFEDYTKLKYQLTYELKTLTENVNRLTTYMDKKFDEHEEELVRVANKVDECPNKTICSTPSQPPTPSVSPSIKAFIIVILGVAFLGSLGTAIGVNLLQYVKVPT